MGQTPSKKMGRTRSKELSSSDLADKLASTTITSPDAITRPISTGGSPSTPTGSSPIDMSNATPRGPGLKSGRRDKSSSVSSFSSASGAAARPGAQSHDSFDGSIPASPSNASTINTSTSIPTTSTILSTPSSGLRSSMLGSSPPPSQLGTSPGPSGLGRPSSPTVDGSLSPGGNALSATISRNSIGSAVLDVDNMIGRLLEAGYSGKVTKSPPLKNAEIASVCAAAREVFLSQPTLIELSPPVKIVGDVHGQVRQ